MAWEQPLPLVQTFHLCLAAVEFSQGMVCVCFCCVATGPLAQVPAASTAAACNPGERIDVGPETRSKFILPANTHHFPRSRSIIPCCATADKLSPVRFAFVCQMINVTGTVPHSFRKQITHLLRTAPCIPESNRKH